MIPRGVFGAYAPGRRTSSVTVTGGAAHVACLYVKGQADAATVPECSAPRLIYQTVFVTGRGREMSFILIGFGKKTFKDLGESGPAHRCVWCSKMVSYRLVRALTWFNWFFIPVFPYRREYRV